jgi:hypothetical protein
MQTTFQLRNSPYVAEHETACAFHYNRLTFTEKEKVLVFRATKVSLKISQGFFWVLAHGACFPQL